MELRIFRNDDSPVLAAIWNAQPPLRGRLKVMTPAILEQHVLSKPYFDPHGILVACDSSRPVGFAHAGHMPGLRAGEMDKQLGIISLLMVDPAADIEVISRMLLEASEQYLRTVGATEFLGGGCGLHAPFYLGLYGGCRLPGVLKGDQIFAEALRRSGYQQQREIQIWHRFLNDFRPPVDRNLIALRRQFRIQPLDHEGHCRWHDACAYHWTDPEPLDVVATTDGIRCGTLTFWQMEPLASSWGLRAVGLAELEFGCNVPQKHFAICFLSEAIKHFQNQGVHLMEVQTEAADSTLIEACQQLGFKPIDAGQQWRKLCVDEVV